MYWPALNMKYKGFWKDGRQEGLGECTWYHSESKADKLMKTRHVGFWKRGRQDGYGVAFFANHDVLLGNWVNGKKEGWFLVLDAHGQEKMQSFSGDKLLQDGPPKTTGSSPGIPGLGFYVAQAQAFVERLAESHRSSRGTVQAIPSKANSQTLEEMNVYRHIVNVNELFGPAEVPDSDKKAIFEVSILLLIRYHGILKGIFENIEHPQLCPGGR